VGPYFVDWTSYRADFEREASAILGRKVTVQGAATARLLPFPSVTFSDVAVAGGPDGTPAMTVETFSMDAELAPFMSGSVHIFDMRLVRPKAHITIDENGAVDWTMRPSAPFDASHISLEKLTITEGQIVVHRAAGGRDHLLSEINTQVSARSFAGPWRIDGTLRLDGARANLQLSTGKLGEDGALKVRMKVDPVVYPLVVEADGDVSIKDGVALYAGAFKVDARSVSKDDLRGIGGATFKLKEPDDAKTPPPYRLNGRFALDHKKLDISEFRFETGSLEDPYTADGKALVDLGSDPRFSIEATGAQVRFDESIAAGAETPAGLTFKDRIAALQTVLVDLPKPAIPGSINVNLPAIVAGDTTFRDVRMLAEPVAGGWQITDLAATLPGRTTLEANGLLRTDTELGFEGSLLLAVAQPSGFAAWLARDVDDAIRRLPAAGFKAKVDLAAAKQSFHDLELILGRAKFLGTIDAKQPADARPSMQLALEGGALDVDGLAAFASLFVSDAGANRAADQDLDLTVKAGPVALGGLEAETVDTALRIRGGQLEVDRLTVGGLAGASISATASLRDFATRPTGSIDASVVAVDLGPLVSALARHYPANVLLRELDKRVAAYQGLLDDTRIDMVASAAAGADGAPAMAISANGHAGGSVFSLTASGSSDAGKFATAPLSVSFSATNENAEALVALYGLPTLPLGMIGPGETSFLAKGTLAGGLETTTTLTADDFGADFAGALALGPDGASVKGKVGLRAADLEPWLMTAGVTLPGLGLGLPVEFAADAAYGNAVLSLDGLTGTVDEGAFSGSLVADFSKPLPHLTGGLDLDALDLGHAAAMVLGDAALAPGEGLWPETAFQPKASSPFTADIALSAGTAFVGMLGTASEARMDARLDGEGIRIANLEAKAYDGTLSGLFELKNTGGTALFTGQLKLTGADLAILAPASGVTGRADITANLSSSGKSAEALAASLSGSGTAAVRDIVVEGANPDALQAIIARADAIGRDIDSAQAATFVPELAGNGTFAAGSADIPFTVAGGVLRSPPVTFAAPAATLSAELRADASTALVSATGEIAFQAGDEALVGSAPIVRYSAEGPLGAVERRFDAEPMAQFLTQRALEREQARVEAMQAVLLEKQRLRREVRYYASLQTERDKAAEALRQAEAEARAKAEAEAKAKAEEEARRKAEEQAALDRAAAEKAEAEVARKEAEARRAADAARKAAEEEAQKPKPEIERAPLPPAGADAAPSGASSDAARSDNSSDAARSGSGGNASTFSPLSIDSFLRTLQGSQ